MCYSYTFPVVLERDDGRRPIYQPSSTKALPPGGKLDERSKVMEAVPGAGGDVPGLLHGAKEENPRSGRTYNLERAVKLEVTLLDWLWARLLCSLQWRISTEPSVLNMFDERDFNDRLLGSTWKGRIGKLTLQILEDTTGDSTWKHAPFPHWPYVIFCRGRAGEVIQISRQGFPFEKFFVSLKGTDHPLHRQGIECGYWIEKTASIDKQDQDWPKFLEQLDQSSYLANLHELLRRPEPHGFSMYYVASLRDREEEFSLNREIYFLSKDSGWLYSEYDKQGRPIENPKKILLQEQYRARWIDLFVSQRMPIATALKLTREEFSDWVQEIARSVLPLFLN